MLTVGLTGPTGAGKGLFCKAAEELCGIHVIDTDKTARKVVEKGSECLKELTAFFGNEILNCDGTLNRGALAGIAFSDKEKHNALNRITHKYILLDIAEELKKAKEDCKKMCIVDAPLLFESSADKMCDVCVAVISDCNVRKKRIMERDGIDEQSAKRRMDAQQQDSFYVEKCKLVLYNNKSPEEFLLKSKELLLSLLNNER